MPNKHQNPTPDERFTTPIDPETSLPGPIAVNPDHNWVVELADPQGNEGYLSNDGKWADTIGPAQWFVSEDEAEAADIPDGVTRRITLMMAAPD